ncbi:MAG: hypothetical protein KME49_26905 [Brasilonema octagenarum HA4186-MV1]|jgi:hypothetical protein|nr:hypothetical protein [Brasilonema octagenarum HA4186-MV1]
MTGELRRPNSPRPANTTTSQAVQPAANVSSRVQPEQMSLSAHRHIQKYLTDNNQNRLKNEDVTAVLRLSQHLRVFGLLSAVGYINQSDSKEERNQPNAQQGRSVRDRTEPVWKSLLGQLIAEITGETKLPSREQLMENVVRMANNEPARYMASWRKAMMIAHHWNFWAKAYEEES